MGVERVPAKKAVVPQYSEFYWPVIRALKETGGSASIAEMYERVVAEMELSEETLAVPHGDGTTSEVEYRLAWARTHLKKVGAIDNSEPWILERSATGLREADLNILSNSASKAWNGVLNPRHLRGARLVVRTISWMSWSDVRSISRWRGSHRRRRPLAFSTPPFCHEA